MSSICFFSSYKMSFECNKRKLKWFQKFAICIYCKASISYKSAMTLDMAQPSHLFVQ